MSTEPEERDLAGEATEREAYLRRLRADISPEEAAEDLALREAEQELYDDEPVCERCHGDGMDPWNDYLFECPNCQGRQTP